MRRETNRELAKLGIDAETVSVVSQQSPLPLVHGFKSQSCGLFKDEFFPLRVHWVKDELLQAEYFRDAAVL